MTLSERVFKVDLRNLKRATAAAILLGVGLAGLLDTIIFHQILQWHHMVSNKISPNSLESVQINVLSDGLFLVFALIVTILGIALLWNVSNSNKIDKGLLPSQMFIGLVILTFGLFNFVEGIINHHILGLHHVKDDPNPLIFDISFLILGGLLLIAIGWILIRKSKYVTQKEV
ncbi:MAG: DUF2243 domain-containing protein [Thermoproteota archaeon]|nr:DUF2243 domain-containing protein [Thermoproteota archaeon]